MEERGKHMFPLSILYLFKKIEEIKGTSVCLDNGKGEAEIHAPDEKEASEEEERRAFELLEELKKELQKSGFKIKDFDRSGGIDAIRIYLGNNDEGGYMESSVETVSSVCKECGGNIERAKCRTHEEPYEIGHKDACSHKQVIKNICAIEN